MAPEDGGRSDDGDERNGTERDVESERPVSSESEDDDGLSPEQFRWLLAASVGVAVLFLLVIGGVSVASHVYGVGGGPEGAPDTTFSVVTERDDGGLAVNVTNEGPQAANPDEIVIVVDGERRGNWTVVGGETGAEIVAPGHSAVIEDVEEGQLVTVYWERGDRREELGQSVVQAPD